jgi:hypothetical protein
LTIQNESKENTESLLGYDPDPGIDPEVGKIEEQMITAKEATWIPFAPIYPLLGPTTKRLISEPPRNWCTHAYIGDIIRALTDSIRPHPRRAAAATAWFRVSSIRFPSRKWGVTNIHPIAKTRLCAYESCPASLPTSLPSEFCLPTLTEVIVIRTLLDAYCRKYDPQYCPCITVKRVRQLLAAWEERPGVERQLKDVNEQKPYRSRL